MYGIGQSELLIVGLSRFAPLAAVTSVILIAHRAIQADQRQRKACPLPGVRQAHSATLGRLPSLRQIAALAKKVDNAAPSRLTSCIHAADR